MKIRDAIGQYIAWRQAHGTQFKSGSVLLHCFLKGIDTEIRCDAVTEAQVRAFLRGKDALTRYRANKGRVAAGSYPPAAPTDPGVPHSGTRLLR